MVKNKQWLSSLVRLRQCAGLEERGEWEEEKKLRETKERQGGKPHLCQDGFQMDMKTEGQRQTHAEAQAEFWAATSQCLSPFVSCYHNDAELCRLLTSPLGWLEKEAWLCFFSLGRDAHPLKQTLTGWIPVVYLDSVLISSIQGGHGPIINNTYLDWRPSGTLNGQYFVLFSNLSKTVEHVSLFSPVKHRCSEHFHTLMTVFHFSLCFLPLKLWGFPTSIAALHWFVMKARTHLHVSSYLFLYLAGYKSLLFGYGLTFLTLCATHTHETWLQHSFSVRRAYIVCRARGGLWCNQYQISAVSLWALILSGSLDWLLAAYAIPLFSPTSPISSSFVPTLCTLLLLYMSASPLLLPFPLFPFFLLLLLFSFLPLPSSFPRHNHLRDCSSSPGRWCFHSCLLV